MYLKLLERFKKQTEIGLIKILNFAASDIFGDSVEFYSHKTHQGISGLSHDRAEFAEGSFHSRPVFTIDWNTLRAQQGLPYYMKIDIEGQEASFLRGMLGSAHLPEYISVECHTLQPVEMLFALGYRLFKLIDQNPPGGFHLPTPQREGLHIKSVNWTHSSGPFGQELPETEWLSFEDFKVAYEASRPEYARSWFDCHAWLPTANFPSWIKAEVIDEADRIVPDC